MSRTINKPRILWWLLRLKQDESHQNSGFSLVEKIVSLVIASIITTGLVAMISQLVQYNQRESAFIATEAETQKALNYITEDLREAVYVYPEHTSTLISGLPDFSNVPGLGPNTEPILIFWRTETIPESELPSGCTAGNGFILPEDIAECNLLINQRTMYVLVAYLQTTDPDPKWKGESRIVRYALPKYIEPRRITRPAGFVDPARFENNFATWPEDSSGINQQTAGIAVGRPNPNGTDQPKPQVLADFIDKPNRTQFQDASNPDLPPRPFDCPQGYLRTPRTFSSHNSFFTCIRDTAGELGANQDIIVYLRGNAQGRDNLTKTTEYIPALEAQVTLRGVIDKFD